MRRVLAGISSLAVAVTLLSVPSLADDPGRPGLRTRQPELGRPPDLVPFNVGVGLCLSPPIPCESCPSVTEYVGVKNQGGSPANGRIVVQLFGAGPTSLPQPIHTKTVTSVPAGGTVTIGVFSRPWECPGRPPSPALRYRLVVDRQDAIAESNEGNNSAVLTLKGQFSPR